MTIRFLALDLDGTVIGSALRVSDAVVAAVERARAAGVGVTIVTGRMFRAARPFAQALGVSGPIVCYQGAATFEVASGRKLSETPLPPEVVADCFAFAREHGVRVLAYEDDRFVADGMDRWVQLYADVSTVPPVIVDSLDAHFAGKPSTKVNFVMERERTEQLAGLARARLGSRAYVTRSNPEFVEIVNAAVDKGKALAAVVAAAGYRLDETLAVGDSFNDLPLLRAAGFGVAMGSAPPELKALADAVVADVAHDGVAEAIDRYVLGAGEVAR